MNNEWCSDESISRDIFLVSPFFLYFLLNLADNMPTYVYLTFYYLLQGQEWPWTSKNWHPPSQCWDYRHELPQQVYAVLGTYSGALGMLGKTLYQLLHSPAEKHSCLLEVGWRWSAWYICLQLPSFSQTLHASAAPPSCTLHSERLCTLRRSRVLSGTGKLLR